MNYIERYVHAVKKHLPASQKEDVGNEIRTLILEQVSEEDEFSKIEKVLKSLGSPKKLAYSYRDQDRYLIGPDHFELYKDVLKVALAIFVGLNIVLSLLSGITAIFTEGPSVGLWFSLVFSDLIGTAITSALTTFAVVTIGFVAAIHFNWIDQNDEWMLKELPELPKGKVNDTFRFRSHLFETIAVFVGFTILLFVLRLPWLAFGEGHEMTIITPANYNNYFPYFLGLISFYLVIQIIYLKQQALSRFIIGLRIVLYILILVTIGMMFFGQPAFLNPSDIQTLAELIGVTQARLESQINIILGAILLGITIARGFDIYKDVKQFKKQP